jgi:hypothetical protein
MWVADVVFCSTLMFIFSTNIKFSASPNLPVHSTTTLMSVLHSIVLTPLPDALRAQFACSSMADLTNFAQHNIFTVVGEWSTAVTDCTQWLNGTDSDRTPASLNSADASSLSIGRGVGARWDGTWYQPNTPFGSCDGWTGSSSTFSSDYKTFLRKYVDLGFSLISVYSWR